GKTRNQCRRFASRNRQSAESQVCGKDKMKMMGRLGGILLLLALLVSFCAAQTQAAPQEEKANYAKAHYTKYEYRIPEREGNKLFTSVYVPKDSSQPYPILMQRTPYSVGPYGEDQYKEHLGPS